MSHSIYEDKEKIVNWNEKLKSKSKSEQIIYPAQNPERTGKRNLHSERKGLKSVLEVYNGMRLERGKCNALMQKYKCNGKEEIHGSNLGNTLRIHKKIGIGETEEQDITGDY